MCGRYELFLDKSQTIRGIVHQYQQRFGLAQIKTGEIFPTNQAPVLAAFHEQVEAVPCVWGFPKYNQKGVMINARSETVEEKKTFRESFFKRRCVVLSTGFYEWKQDETKQKYWFSLPAEDKALYMAGIWNSFGGTPSFVILTTDANDTVRPIHNRMPVIVPAYQVQSYIEDIPTALMIISARQPSLEAKTV